MKKDHNLPTDLAAKRSEKEALPSDGLTIGTGKNYEGKIVIQFGRQIDYMIFTPEQAVDFIGAVQQALIAPTPPAPPPEPKNDNAAEGESLAEAS